jgi:TRAP-type C4-dicarboxylate transport system substrate-binding protein
MMKTSFAMGPALLALAVGLCAGPAGAQQIVLKVHQFLPAVSNPQVNLIQPWCDKVNKESNDRLKCQIYPSMQLGGTPAQLIDQARDGVVDLVWALPTYAAGRFTKSEVFELPFLTKSSRASSQALWDYVQKNALDEFRGTKPIFMHVHDGAVFHFTSKQPRTLEDLKGLKVRAATRINSLMLTALGITPVQMPLPAVTEAMSKGVIDGAMVPWEGVPTIKLQEVAKYSLDVPDGWPKISNSIFIFAMNQARYNSLPADLKKVIDNNSGRAVSADAGERGFDRVIEPNRKQSRDRGNTLATLTPAELQRWIKASENLDDEWIKEANAKGADGKKLLEEARALIKKYDK